GLEHQGARKPGPGDDRASRGGNGEDRGAAAAPQALAGFNAGDVETPGAIGTPDQTKGHRPPPPGSREQTHPPCVLRGSVPDLLHQKVYHDPGGGASENTGKTPAPFSLVLLFVLLR